VALRRRCVIRTKHADGLDHGQLSGSWSELPCRCQVGGSCRPYLTHVVINDLWRWQCAGHGHAANGLTRVGAVLICFFSELTDPGQTLL
jgi:hypothetical protein